MAVIPHKPFGSYEEENLVLFHTAAKGMKIILILQWCNKSAQQTIWNHIFYV